MPYLFEGRLIKKPQAVSVVKDENLVQAGTLNPTTIAILGSAAAGKPEYPYEFYSASDALAVFLSGNLPDAIRRAYQPGGGAGAYRVIGMRLNGDAAISLNRAVQATKVLNDSTPAAALTLTAGEWGLQGNNLSVAIADGTDAGTKAVTVSWRGADIIGQNIGIKGITVIYTGSGTTAAAAVTATAFTTTIGVATGDAVNLLFAGYATLQQLVDALNGTGKYTASVTGPNPDAPTTDLDVVTAADIKTATIEFSCNLAAMLAWFNSLDPAILTASEAGGSGKALANVAKTAFTGGVDPTITTNSWQQAFDLLAAEDVQIVVPVSSDPAVHSMAKTHCETMSGIVQKSERVAIVGGAWGEAVSAARGAALTLNSDRAQRVYPGIYEDGGDGTLVQVPPYMVAAIKAGMTAGLPVGTSATYQYLNAAGVEAKLSLSAIEALLDNHVCVVEFAQGRGYRIVQDLTTWARDTRITRTELALRLALDSISRRLRLVADGYIGRPVTPSFAGEVTGAIQSELARMASAQLIVGDSANPPYRDLQLSAVGDKVSIKVRVSLGAPANYIGITIVPDIFSGVA